MLQALLLLSLVGLTSTYHLGAELREHSTTLDYLRTTNKTINNLLEGKIDAKCVACELFVELLQLMVRSNASESEIVYLIQEACIYLHIEDQRVCYYIIDEFHSEFITVAARLLLHPAWLCYAAVGPECGAPPDLFPFWKVEIPGNKPPREPLTPPPAGAPTLRVVQLSDLHVDLDYKTGGVKGCGEPLCCREGKGSTPEDQAGFWGSLNAYCDIPLRTFENALKFIAEEIKPDLILWTGDIPAHDVWTQSHADQLRHIQLTADLLVEHLPRVPVLPSLGNHESAPVDSFPPPGLTSDDLSNAWLNLFVQKIWSRWIPPESLQTVGYAGYYATQITAQLRIISLNTQYCDDLNFWLYLNNTDPGGQLQWLVQELTWAEKWGMKVMIIGHIPTGNSGCMRAFSWNYYKIIDRFEAVVVGQFMGHTHQDHLSIMYSEEEDHHPTGFQFVSPSITTYYNLRPAIRVYTIDGHYGGSTYRPLKSETYLLDLDKANKENVTNWELEYDSMNAYNLTWLVPETMQQLYIRFKNDRQFFEKTFWKYRFHSNPDNPCNDSDYYNNLCEMITGRSHDTTICKDIPLKVQQDYQLKHKMC